ncbi:DUF3598 family protein [Halotia branconii]|uniref:DUF3598 family protein n=1 Tax=Halotia branconii CENA392 TaxID=1539056 RepID=A0AAJ6NRR1_9CYAN|nr:DUF3598 family protein [Halotia branconii]WGV25299.1 DUF3598 family protein [Halotia branconii CENA392]
MNLQLQNWSQFCRYYSQDLYGTWTRYYIKEQFRESLQCIRSFRANDDCSEISHQNHYIYADGTKESKTFGPYLKPITNGLFLDTCFSWGSKRVEPGIPFFFDTCLRDEDRRATAIARYNESGSLQRITVLVENLNSFAESSPVSEMNNSNGNWQGTLIKMTPDWTVYPETTTSWIQLHELSENNLILNLNDGVSVSFPQSVESGRMFFLTMDWLSNDTLLQRAIRHYDPSDFTSLTLEIFTPPQ